MTVLSEDGVPIGERIVPWRQVQRVVAYKRDLITVDQICVDVETEAGVLCLDEEMSHWKAAIRVLERRLPGFPAEEMWWVEVVAPAFARNERVLYERVSG